MKRSRSWALLLTGVWAGILVANGAAAQEEEILVTARKIEENLREIPLAITAFGEQDIEAADINSLADVASLTPGLQFFNPLGETLPAPFIRGIAPVDIRDSELNVGIFIDGVYVSAREGLNFSQLDVERIEVVKGPQSALYGRTAFSGAINYITKRPTDEFEATASTTVGNDGKVLGKGSVSGPLIDGLLNGRIGALFDTWDGSYDNPISSEGVGGYEYRTVQGSLQLTPSDNVTALLSVYYSDDDIDDSATTAIPTNCEDSALFDPVYQDANGVPVGVNEGNFCGEVPKLNGTDIGKIAGAWGEERELTRASLTVDWDLDFGTFSFLTGYDDAQQAASVDFGRNIGYNTPFIYCTGTNLSPACQQSDPDLRRFFSGVLNSGITNETQEYSQEIRFTSLQDQPLRYSVGAYYFSFEREQANGDPYILSGPPADLTRFCPCLSLSPGFILSPFGDFIFGPTFSEPAGDVERKNEEDAFSVFGSVDVDFLERFTARFEARYTDNHKKQQEVLAGFPAQDENWDYFTGRVGLDFKVNDLWMLYGSVGRGVKAGGFDSDTADVANSDGTGTEEVVVQTEYDLEKILSTEVGIKGVTSDGGLALDIAIFHSDWQDIVLPQVLTATPDGQPILGTIPALNDNAGDATVRGYEITADMRFTDNWSSRLALSYTDSVFDEATLGTFRFFPSFEPDGDVSGNQVLRVSPWQVSGTLNFTRPIAGDWELRSRADVIWQDQWFIGADNQGVVPDHTYVNFRLGVDSGRYSVDVFVDNVFEDDSPIGAYRDIYWTNTQDVFAQNTPPTSTLADFPLLRLTVSQPRLRTYGLTARVRFGGAE